MKVCVCATFCVFFIFFVCYTEGLTPKPLKIQHIEDIEDEMMFGSWFLRFCAEGHPKCKKRYLDAMIELPRLVNLADINCAEHEEQCLDAGVTEAKYPAFRLYKEFDKTRYHFPLEQYENKTTRQVAQEMWDWADEKLNSQIVVFRDDNYQELLAGKTWVINFINSWDLHSKLFKKEWRQIAKKLKDVYPKLNIGEATCTNSPDVCGAAGIKYAPTVLYISRGQFIEFEGDRSMEGFMQSYTQENILHWMSTIVKPPKKKKSKRKTEL